MVYRCYIKSCPHFAAPCEFNDFNAKCPIGEIDGFDEICDPWNEFFCLVVGSRSFTDYKQFSMVMDRALKNKQGKKIIIVSGGAEGTDSMAEKYAAEKDYKLYVINADWDKGPKAGYTRNVEMHRFIAAHEDRGCIAFWDGKSKGTQHSFELAAKFNNQIRIVRV